MLFRAAIAGIACCIAVVLATTVDRIAVVVGNQVITETEILREIALAAFLNSDPPSYTAVEKRKVADRLVEQKLIRREMELSHYPEATGEQKKELLAETAKRAGGALPLQQQMTALGLTESDLEEHLSWQLTLVRFIDLRFRPAIQVSPQDIQDYYRDQVLPRQPPGQNISMNDIRDRIRQTLSEQRADQQLDEWLKHAKTTTRIEYKKEVFP